MLLIVKTKIREESERAFGVNFGDNFKLSNAQHVNIILVVQKYVEAVVTSEELRTHSITKLPIQVSLDQLKEENIIRQNTFLLHFASELQTRRLRVFA